MKKYQIIYADPPWNYKVYSKKELLEELNIERSVFYDRKREAIYLFSVCLFGYSIPEVLEELPRLNSD